MNSLYVVINDEFPHIKGSIVYQSEDFPKDNIYAIVSCLFRPKENRNNKLDSYLDGILDIVWTCNYVNNPDLSENGMFVTTAPAPKYKHKLCFVLYVDESINDKQYAYELKTIQKCLNYFKYKKFPYSLVPVRIQSIQYVSQVDTSNPMYHLNMFPTIFRHIVPMIDPDFQMAMCIDLDTAKIYLNSFKKFLAYSLKEEYKNTYGAFYRDQNLFHYEYARIIIDYLCDSLYSKPSIYNITGSYSMPHSWDIFDLSKPPTVCPSYYFETLYLRMKEHRPLFIKINAMLYRILAYVKELNRHKYLGMEKPPLNSCSLEDIENYVKDRLVRSFWISEPVIKYTLQNKPDIYSCGGEKPYLYYLKNTYGFDEIVINSLFMPIFIKQGLYRYQERYNLNINLPRMVRDTPSPVSSGGTEKHLYKHRWYKIRIGERGGRYIIVKKCKIYIS